MGQLTKKIKSKELKKFFSSNSYDRNLELMELLATDRTFKQMVSDAKKRLNIPSKGIDGSDKALEEWDDWLVQESDRIIASEDYNKTMASIRKQLKEGLIGHQEAEELGKKNDDKIPINHFGNVAKKVCIKFNLPLHFDESIKTYILTGKIDAPQHNYRGGEFKAWERPWREATYIPINIYTRLTNDEWDELRHYVDDLAKRWNLPRHPRIRKIKDYAKVENAYEEKRQKDELTGKEYSRTSAEVADILFGDPKKDSRVRDMVRKIDKLRKERLTPKTRGKN